MLCRLCVRNIFHGNALAGFFSVVAPAPKARQFQIPYKLIVYLYHLFAVFAGARDLVHINAVNEFLQERCCELIHLHEFPNSGNELFFPELHFIHIRQAFTVCGDFLFQFQPFGFVLLRKPHKHLVTQFARYIVLIAPNAQLRYLLTANNTLLLSSPDTAFQIVNGAYEKMLIELAIDEYVHIVELRLKSDDDKSVVYEYCADHNKDWGEIRYTFGEDDYDVNRYIYTDRKGGFFFATAGEWIMRNTNIKYIPRYMVISL